MALRAARNAGIQVDKAVIDRAVEYVRRSQNPDGGFRYMLNSGGSAFARSAAGLSALLYDGISHGPEGSVDKLLMTEVEQAVGHAAISVGGAGHAPDDDDTSLRVYLYSRAQSVMGGTSQIQRNLIAERILGLPTA